MIGRCDSGHIHPASSEDHASLRALDAVTPTDDIIKVPARYFLPQEVIPQELENCMMLTRVRFQCPSMTMTINEYANNAIEERFRLLEEKISQFEKPIPRSTDDDVVISLKSKIENLEANFEKINMVIAKDWDRMVEFQKTTIFDMELIKESVREVIFDIHDFRMKNGLYSVIDDRIKSQLSSLLAKETKIREECEEKVLRLEEKISKIELTDRFDGLNKRMSNIEYEMEQTSVLRIAQIENKVEKLDRFDGLLVRVANLENGIEQIIEDVCTKKMTNDNVDSATVQQLEAKIRKFEQNVPIAPNSLTNKCWLGNCIVDLESRIAELEGYLNGKLGYTAGVYQAFPLLWKPYVAALGSKCIWRKIDPFAKYG